MLPIYLCTSIHATLNFKKLTFWELIFRELTFWEVDILGVDISGVDILGVDILTLTHSMHHATICFVWWYHSENISNSGVDVLRGSGGHFIQSQKILMDFKSFTHPEIALTGSLAIHYRIWLRWSQNCTSQTGSYAYFCTYNHYCTKSKYTFLVNSQIVLHVRNCIGSTNSCWWEVLLAPF